LIIPNPLAFGLLAATVSALAFVGAAYFRDRRRWASMRLRMTHDLVERMVGHRTRLAQEPAAMRHRDEDEGLERYLGESKRMDRAALALSLMPRVWLLAAIVALTPQLVRGGGSQPAMAASLGAMLLAFGAFSKLTESVSYLADAAISWTQARPLLEALRRQEPRGHLDAVRPMTRGGDARVGPLLVGHDLAFRYADRTDLALRRCDFEIGVGDRIHLSGESGGGKSTLVSLLTGLRTPASGLLLLNGLDRATLGTRAWRRRVAAAPQFHENHLFSDTLAFNLLMGRRWPPTADDLRWADTVCRRLGLGDLLDRMPAGLFQVVGETGWQLSHGERSRVFMARALLQGADLVVLDESFAELDPDSLQRCLPQAADLARTLVVVAHA
jgi:ATP-binding cassette subfamily B protein